MKSTKEGLINNISKNIRYKDIYLNPNNCKVNPITTQQYPTPAKRPKNTLMNKDKIVNIFGMVILDWTESIQACIKNIEDKQ